MAKKAQKGMTLMSVMIATALSGVIGLMVIRLMGNQAEAMLVIKLREERETLIKHYRQVIISGWDNTMKGGGTTVRRGRTGTASFPLSLKENLYSPLPSGTGWWEVSATIGTASSGHIQHSDAYHSSGTGGLHREQNYTVTLTVDFDPTKHDVVKMDLASRREVIYMGYRWQKTKQTGCGSDSATALTRRDTTGATAQPLYHPDSQGAIVSYSSFSNYAKCSQVPLVSNVGECPKVGAILGFESKGTGAGATPTYRQGLGYVTGRLACSYPLATPTGTPESAWKTALGNKRYYTLHNKVWDSIGPTPTPTSSSACVNLDKSYIDFVTAVTSDGTGGGRLICEPTLIAPQLFKDYYERTSKRSSPAIAGSQLGVYSWNLRDKDQPGPLNACYSYPSYNGSTNPLYRHHVGGGGYNVKHSGGLTHFTSTGAGSGARRDPFRARNTSRGVPGDRGDPGICDCGYP